MIYMFNYFSKKIRVSSQAIDILKLVAIITMFMDHYAILVVKDGGAYYELLRAIGRITFPLFAFLLTYNYIFNTKNKEKYLFRILIFGIISEPIYRFVFDYPGEFNILITLFLSMSVLYLFEYTQKLVEFTLKDKNTKIPFILFLIIMPIITTVMSIYIISSDYSIFGVLLIVAFYLWIKKTNIFSFILLFISTILLNYFGQWGGNEFLKYQAVIALIFILISINPLFLVNFKKKFSIPRLNKWFFYIFYPVHLLFIWILSLFL